MQYLTSLGKEHHFEGLFKLEKSWAKYLNANSDFVGK
jgi:hypothetical protein